MCPRICSPSRRRNQTRCRRALRSLLKHAERDAEAATLPRPGEAWKPQSPKGNLPWPLLRHPGPVVQRRKIKSSEKNKIQFPIHTFPIHTYFRRWTGGRGSKPRTSAILRCCHRGAKLGPAELGMCYFWKSPRKCRSNAPFHTLKLTDMSKIRPPHEKKVGFLLLLKF